MPDKQKDDLMPLQAQSSARAGEDASSGQKQFKTSLSSKNPTSELRRQFERLLDQEGRITAWPLKKRNVRMLILDYLAGKFEVDRAYTETEVNRILGQAHTFNDSALLRRALCDYGMLERTRDGAWYWKEGSSRIWLSSLIYGMDGDE